MAGDNVPPKFWSLEFHTRFFPRVLGDRLRRRKKETPGISFTSTTEMFIAFAVCLILAIIGFPSAWAEGSVFGWILSVGGGGGIAALIVQSVAGHRGRRPSYDDFLAGVFLFFVILGAFVGLPVGMDRHSFWLGLSASLAGLGAGYLLGILAGLRLQHLGWVAIILNMLGLFGTLVVGGTAVVLMIALIA